MRKLGLIGGISWDNVIIIGWAPAVRRSRGRGWMCGIAMRKGFTRVWKTLAAGRTRAGRPFCAARR